MGCLPQGGCLAGKHSDEPVKKYNILTLAILFSAVWHLFWLSAVSIVVVPSVKRPVKFSGVSFLGPILDRGAMTLSAASVEKTPSEKRFLAYLEDSYGEGHQWRPESSYVEFRPVDGSLPFGDEGFPDLAVSAGPGDKAEPGRDMD